MGIFLTRDPWSAAVRDALPGLIPLGLLGLWRWGMFLFRVVGYLMYKPQPPTSVDAFSTSDVTLIIPTIDTDEEAMHEAMRSWVLNQPHAIIIVTVGENLQKELQKIASRSIAADITTVLSVEKPANKRIQLVHGINTATTDLVCFTDDDAIWNANFLKWLLVPFNDEKMGGTGSSQIMRPNDLTRPPTVFERIADMRLSGRMLEAAASTFYDGSVSCLSGRTALYHKRILNDSFPLDFTGELWRNKYPLISGDDKFMTRWIVSHGWKMSMQISPECTLATTFKADGKFFMQILRWTRNTWRSDFKSLVLERDIWYRYPVQAVLMVDRMISPFTLMAGPILFVLSMILVRTIESWTDVVTAICIYIVWVLVSRTIRIIPHFYRCPEDITYLIFFIGYQYYFAVLKLYALFTLHVTSWGTREGVAAAGAGGKKGDDEEVDPEVAHEQRVQMAKKGRMANKTYQKGNIALMRRIHMHNLDDDGEMDEAVRARLSQAGTLYGGPGTPGSMYTGMGHAAPGSTYSGSQVPSLYPGGSVAGYGSHMPQYFSRMHGPGSLYGGTWSQAYSAAPSQAYSQVAPSMGAPSMGAPSMGAPSVGAPASVVSRQ